MRVVVLGTGVIGVTSAWYLAKAVHDVTVTDRQPAPALETSFANAGEISPGYASPLAAPGIPMKALKWLMMTHSPLIIQPRLDLATVQWVLQMLSNCTSSAYAINKSRTVRLAVGICQDPCRVISFQGARLAKAAMGLPPSSFMGERVGGPMAFALGVGSFWVQPDRSNGLPVARIA